MATRGRKVKYNPNLHPKQVLKYTLLGLTDKQLAGVLGIVESTLNLWKKKYPEFSESIRAGKIDADANVASTLYKRSLGHTQVKQYAFKVKGYDEKGRQIEKVEIVEVEEYFPPSDNAINMWLSNRQRKTWGSKSEIEHSGELKGKTTIVFSKGAKEKD
ncbi:terminase [Chryseobacterium sp. T16E-39]|uniref:terminase n=1 Tax=Chryseobacterium sp. T16E-39 TaxID=2015076 RepID=UPI001E57C231|nr:terminase [Chryseobacterium sp. T16E-39]